MHGYNSNNHVTTFQLKQHQERFSHFVEFVPINGPFVCKNEPDPALAKLFPGPFYTWMERGTDDSQQASKSLYESIAYIITFMNEHGPFDGIMGFSQGSTMAQLMYYTLQENLFQSDEVLKYPLPTFMIFVGAFAARFLMREKVNFTSKETYIKIPTLHMLGTQDFIFEISKILTYICIDPILIVHNEGHKFPNLKGVNLKIFEDFLHKEHAKRCNKDESGEIIERKLISRVISKL